MRLNTTPAVKKYLKKLKDKNLMRLFEVAIEDIRVNPYDAGEKKDGDLSGLYCYDFNHQKTAYRVAYTIEIDENGNEILLILAGTREQFYKELKRYMNSSTSMKKR